jgi:ribosome-associated toxin RatA of RatAB toxin-antitoxin module
MRAERAIFIRAPLDDVYDLARAVERWPALAPCYQSVRVRGECGRRRLVEVAARRDWIPIHWLVVQECHPDVPEITYRHVGGITAGLIAEWSFAAGRNGVEVTVRREVDPARSAVGRSIAKWIVGPFLVEHVVDRTLTRIKTLAEAPLACRRGEAVGSIPYRDGAIATDRS